MRDRRLLRTSTLVMLAVLAASLLACADDAVEEDPQGALRDAVMALRDWDGVEVTLGAQLDQAAQASVREEGDLSDEELALLMDSNLMVRGASTGDEEEDDGELEMVLTVADEEVLSLRSLPGYRLYALIDLAAMEQVAESLEEDEAFRETVAEMQRLAGMVGMQEVFDAAREGEWIRVTGVEQMANMVGGMLGDGTTREPDEEELEQAGRNIAERLVRFLDDEGVTVTHVDSEDAGERVNVTVQGRALRELLGDVLAELDRVDGLDPTGAGMGMGELREELDAEIDDDTEVSFDAWIDGGELRQVAVDAFELARAAGEEDVPDGEFLVALALEEFTGGVDEPETEVTFDLFGMMGNMMGGLMGGLGGDPFADEEVAEAVPEEDPGEPTDDGLEEDLGELENGFCLTEEEIDQMLSQMPEEQRAMAEEEIEAGGVPIC